MNKEWWKNPVGIFQYEAQHRDGEIFVYGFAKNAMSYSGMAELVGLMTGQTTSGFTFIAIGTGDAAIAKADIGLASEEHRESATVAYSATTFQSDTGWLYYTFSGYGGSENLTEVAVFNSGEADGGQMLCRASHTAVALDWDAGDQITYNYKIVVS